DARSELVERLGEKATNALLTKGKVRLVTPEEVFEITGNLRASKSSGVLTGGISYLMPANIHRGRTWNILMHELGTHYGYETIFGKKRARDIFDTFVSRRGEDSPMGRAIEEAYKKIPPMTNPAHVNEEALAYFITYRANIKLSLGRKIIAAVRMWAVKTLGVRPSVFTADDYVAIAASAVRRAAREAEEAPVREEVSREIFYAFAGVRAEGMPGEQLAKAQAMLAEGKDKNEVWRETGWMKGVEGKWKFEIDDSKATLKVKESESLPVANPLNKILEHKKLFKAYPDLKYVDVIFNKGRADASYKPSDVRIGAGTISISKHLIPANNEKIQADLLHEIQHAIQEIEGFARGGSPEAMAQKLVNEETNYLLKTNDTYADLAGWIDELYFKGEDYGIHTVRMYREQMQEILNKHLDKKYGEDPALNLYKRLAGEVEAREAAMRKGLTKEQRRIMPPYVGAGGIPQDQWIVIDGKGTSFSVERSTFRERDIRYSIEEQQDLRSWADDLIKSAKDKGVVMDKAEPSPEHLRETSMSILAGLDIQKLSTPARSFAEGMSPKGKGYGQFIEKWIASPEWYQHPVLKEIIGHSLDKSGKFHNLFNDFNAVDDPFAEHDTVAKTMEALARKGGISKAAFILGRTSADFKKLETLLDDADVNGKKWTAEELKKAGYSEDIIRAWSAVRESYDKQLDARLKPLKDLIARIEEQAAFKGIDPKDVEYPDFGEYIIEGKKKRLNLKQATMYMGQLKGFYSPRIRDRGDWVITARKDVAPGRDEFVRYNRRTKSFANLLRDDLAKEGYVDISIEKTSRLPEETFQAIRMAEMGTVIGEAARKG
ncbi:MAG: hypothetical protein IMF10_07920, partial [Proteobacteria bacterium]|nr:hypothetical protein [Pseudomonadota bacterium]